MSNRVFRTCWPALTTSPQNELSSSVNHFTLFYRSLSYFTGTGRMHLYVAMRSEEDMQIISGQEFLFQSNGNAQLGIREFDVPFTVAGATAVIEGRMSNSPIETTIIWGVYKYFSLRKSQEPTQTG